MVALGPDKTINFSSTKIQMISKVQYLPLVKQESFLRAKYEVEGLSPKEIADLTFSSRSTIVKYLETHGIAIREGDRFCGTLPYGKQWKQRQAALNDREQRAIAKAKNLRSHGHSYEKIANIMNTMGIRTKTGRTKWYAKTIRDIILR
jgi:Recombinase.